jgi:hypothetical protein
MNDPYYCKFFLDTEKNIDEVESILDYFISEIFLPYSVECPIFRNENFKIKSNHTTQYDFIENSRYYTEFALIEENPENITDFQLKTAHLIKKIRESGVTLTASCDFEDLIISETGWNWTEESPEPPIVKS